jgi:hypothetical protein
MKITQLKCDKCGYIYFDFANREDRQVVSIREERQVVSICFVESYKTDPTIGEQPQYFEKDLCVACITNIIKEVVAKGLMDI